MRNEQYLLKLLLRGEVGWVSWSISTTCLGHKSLNWLKKSSRWLAKSAVQVTHYFFTHFTHNHLYFCWFKMLVQVTFLFKIRQRLKTRHCESLRPRSNNYFVINSAKQFAFCLQITIRSQVCFTSRTPPHHQLQLQFIGCDITLWANAHEAISRERRWREDGRGNECRTMRNRLKEKGWK